VITSTEPHLSPQQLKDLAVSVDLKGAEAAALADQKKASEIMEDRLPGLTDPNAPAPIAKAPAANGAPPPPNPNAPTAYGGVAVVPKILPAQHPDRFTPGNGTVQAPPNASQGNPTAPQSSPKQTGLKPPQSNGGPSVAPKSATPKPAVKKSVDQNGKTPAPKAPPQAVRPAPKPATPQEKR
jgi:rod shape-determining protein MreC